MSERRDMLLYLQMAGFDHTMENGDHIVTGYGMRFEHTSLACIVKRVGDRLERLTQERDKYKAALEEIRDIDYRGNRHESSVIAYKTLMEQNQ